MNLASTGKKIFPALSDGNKWVAGLEEATAHFDNELNIFVAERRQPA